MTERAPDLAFVVLFGSMARGDYGRGSDYDVLIGLRHEGTSRFLDRLGEFAAYSRDGLVEPIAYYPSEVERMFCSFHQLLLDALEEGVVLHDDGSWAPYGERYQRLRREGWLQRLPRGWRWTEEAEREVTPGLP